MIYDYKVKDTNGETTSLDNYKGKVLLVVNTATGCGFTPQYEGLQKLYDKYKDKGFELSLIHIQMCIRDRGDTTIIAHNAKFDLKFLNYYLDLLGLEPINNHICTLEMLKKCKSYKGKNKKLETACKYYNIVNEHAHRANSDTLATAKLFLTIKDDVE